ncbi:hypothetical protein [Bradyrhizobium sp. Rc2d]|uniref:hypothetical protein n=1 Tax=Bradyrhizobium sp. Rc2d TaxID=1855321 RepID=UPI000B829F25|nr:hypothetical protein [Bradyrhizobium sp. Rc2d]
MATIVIILKLLVGYPNGMASVDDLKLKMVILAKSGQDWSERTRLLAARMPDLSIFTMGLWNAAHSAGPSQ